MNGSIKSKTEEEMNNNNDDYYYHYFGAYIIYNLYYIGVIHLLREPKV